MPVAGDNYTVELKEAHISWGTHRHTNTRGLVYGEGYIHIPRKDAVRLNIYNSHNKKHSHLYTCSSKDGFLKGIRVKASGSMTAGDQYAKQFQGHGNLQAFGGWFQHVNAQVGDVVKVTWTSPAHFEVEKV